MEYTNFRDKPVFSENGFVGSVEGSAYKSVAVTATATGAQVPDDATHVVVTSTNANHIIILPEPSLGRKLTLVNGATGYEIRSTNPETIGINGGTDEDAESAVAANIVVKVESVTPTNWIGSTVTSAGVVGVLQVAAP